MSGRPAVAQANRLSIRRRRRRRVLAALIILVAGFCAATARLLIWPPQGMPARVAAIVVLGGYGNRLGKGIELARQGRARVLVVSLGLPTPEPAVCKARDPIFKAAGGGSYRVLCFQPNPGTTQGEAEFIGRLAKRRHWRSLALVTTPDQVMRARIRFERCYSGHIYVATTPLPLLEWPYEIAYQWAALVKAETLQRSC
jgi:uncharacterized SAM-binding protein YcdF (DUF218 family)